MPVADMVSMWITRLDDRLRGEPNAALDSQLVGDVLALFDGYVPNIRRGLARLGAKVLEGLEDATPSLVASILSYLLSLATG